jgi:hypothetical protein
MQKTIVNVTRIIPRIDELYLFLGIKGVQTVNRGIVKEGLNSVYEPEVQRLARMLLGIEADVESFKALLPRTSEMPNQHRKKRGLAGVMGYISENIYVFYQVTDVHARAMPIGIRLFIDIPLKGND